MVSYRLENKYKHNMRNNLKITQIHKRTISKNVKVQRDKVVPAVKGAVCDFEERLLKKKTLHPIFSPLSPFL